MRKIEFFAMAAASLLMVFAGCSRENLPSSEPFRVRVGVPVGLDSSVSKATFIDGEGMSWADTELSKFVMVTGTDIDNGTVSSATAASLDGNGVATFEFAQAPAEGTTVSFFYMPGGKTNALEYTFESAQKQDTPGKLNPENLCLKAVDVEATESSASPQMQLVGSLQRFLVYSPTGKYASEKIESIKLSSGSNVVGLIAYNKLGQPRKNPGADNTPAETETLVWDQATSVTVTIANPVEIAAAAREETLGKGIYLYLPAGELTDGYQCVITTEEYEYVMKTSSPKTILGGTVSNFFVNLENSAIERREKGTVLQEVKYLGGLPETFTLDAVGKTDHGISYWYATVDGVTRENRLESNYDGRPFYSEENVKFSCTDEDGAPVDWVSCRYRTNDTWWDVTYEANNTGAERRAVVTATYNIPGYIATPSVKKVTLIQPSL